MKKIKDDNTRKMNIKDSNYWWKERVKRMKTKLVDRDKSQCFTNNRIVKVLVGPKPH